MDQIKNLEEQNRMLAERLAEEKARSADLGVTLQRTEEQFRQCREQFNALLGVVRAARRELERAPT